MAGVLSTSADNTAEKQRGRPFEPGQSGNPNGRPKGSRNRVSHAVEALIHGKAEALAAVVSAIRNVFARFAETGSARRVWLWFRSEGLTFPLQMHQGDGIRWVDASYTAIHHVLTNPVYAGAVAP